MPLPVAYTESSLAGWLATELGNVAVLLGWNAAHAQIVAAVADTERVLEIDDVAALEDPRKIERVARACAWDRAVQNLAALVDFSAEGQAAERSQAYRQAKEQHAAAVQAARADLGIGGIRFARRAYAADPFVPESAGNWG